MKRIGSTMIESSVLFPVASVSSLEENGTSVFPLDSSANDATVAIFMGFAIEVAEAKWNLFAANKSECHGR